ncbi:hypothetical protein SAMN05192529_11411 [Arachidicoccus rhizosphaerae]|uniref:TerB family tellurite resistance protein n=1 Tax=Arachidicoccus rhizosphaerae TaxID=551991 RepID=A0A1H4ACA2_9BACT|nr:hypothetical protein [Arachidicoccus rhizosphaerae]SEA33144.1 hypothetical protein SAMN05192529_11411 [Arachidicoccus rhizosphaerae]
MSCSVSVSAGKSPRVYKMKYPVLIKAALLALPFLFSTALKAQTFGEWFSQKKTQKKYLLAQIAALETYMKALEKGYAIAWSGLGAVSEGTLGDYLQHALYFSSLKTVSPPIKNESKALQVVQLEGYINSLRKRLLANRDIDRWLSGSEQTAFKCWSQKVEDESSQDLATLSLLLRDHSLEMTDGERLSQISQLYLSVQKKYGEIRTYYRHLVALIADRKNQQKEASRLRSLYVE